MSQNDSFLITWTIPIGMLTAIIGGSAWLTTTRNLVDQNKMEIIKLSNEVKEMSIRTNVLNERLGRIEEKLDFLVKILETKRQLQ